MQSLVVLRLQIYNLLQQQQTVHLWKGLSFEEGKEVYQILLYECGHFYRRYSYKEKAEPATRQILLM